MGAVKDAAFFIVEPPSKESESDGPMSNVREGDDEPTVGSQHGDEATDCVDGIHEVFQDIDEQDDIELPRKLVGSHLFDVADEDTFAVRSSLLCGFRTTLDTDDPASQSVDLLREGSATTSDFENPLARAESSQGAHVGPMG